MEDTSPFVSSVPGRPPPTAWAAAWPPAAQTALAVSLTVSAAILGWQAWDSLPFAARPSELEQAAAPDTRFDLNMAGRTELLQLPGVGPALADRILAYRQAHGPFGSVAELNRVPGIGPGLIDRLRPWLYVKRVPGMQEDVTAGLTPTPPPLVSTGRPELFASPIDLNSATFEDLQRLPGIGPKLAERIVAARRERPFSSVDDLRRVPGIGAKTVEKLRPFVTANPP
ncbi:MAG: helix-hairpin-helix domain-containing protein [Gemmataceae bacterium]|nr:helix-hairpin-helix domain-containing protein [Gemmataceae bacterium]MDW8264250.1 ComEA family DNA-binding protein [Gemmataceae bacterium]